MSTECPDLPALATYGSLELACAAATLGSLIGAWQRDGRDRNISGHLLGGMAEMGTELARRTGDAAFAPPLGGVDLTAVSFPDLEVVLGQLERQIAELEALERSPDWRPDPGVVIELLSLAAAQLRTEEAVRLAAVEDVFNFTADPPRTM
ncbi:MAG TPA: hypothetical protein PKJ99_12230 [Thermoanaerobaculales bacterium]|nr:hypothetical protein [Thermoanaerobaculales bacterium]HQL30863.1 hypothetical protein [Thermoanaerobaculales bacterium]